MAFKANEGVTVKNDVKDHLFRYIFGAPENRRYLLSLYNAVSQQNHEDEGDITVTTLEDVILVNMKNDVSFLFDAELSLYEHQSTYNPNMPLRGLMYFGHLYDSILEMRGKDLYGSRLIKIPTPKYVVFYNGVREAPDRTTLKLSDAFEVEDKSGEYEWTATMLNINAGHNRELMERCAALREYAEFVSDFRKFKAECETETEAAERAMGLAIERPTLGTFFKKQKGDVVAMLLTEFNQEVYDANRREEGRLEGLLEGELLTLFKLAYKGLLPVDDAAKEAGLTVEAFKEKAGLEGYLLL